MRLDDPRTILGIYLAAFALHFGFEQLLAALNLRRARDCQLHPPPEAPPLMSAEQYQASQRYAAARSRLALGANAAQAAVSLGLILSGALGALQRLWDRAVPVPELAGLLLVYSVSLIFAAASLPFSLVAQFGIEARFGFNRTTPRLFAIDLSKGLALSLVLGTPLLYLVFRLVRATALWWLWAFLAASALQLLIGVLYPQVIAPLFNRFTPLPEGEVREQVTGLARRLGFRARGIFLMDGSRRSTRGNAYFAGLGPARRIVLFDTLLESLNPPQVAAVLAHEIGHYQKRHVPLRLAGTLAAGFGVFWLLGRALGFAPLFRAFGFSGGPAPAMVLLLYFCGPLELALRPIGSWLSRRQEHAADRYAFRDAGCGESFIQALFALARRNLSNPTPHPWASFYHASHPTLLERVRALRRG